MPIAQYISQDNCTSTSQLYHVQAYGSQCALLPLEVFGILPESSKQILLERIPKYTERSLTSRTYSITIEKLESELLFY